MVVAAVGFSTAFVCLSVRLYVCMPVFITIPQKLLQLGV